MAISQHAVPPAVEECRRRIQALETELAIIGRENAVGIDAGAREAERGPPNDGGARDAWPGWRRAGAPRRHWSTRLLALRATLRDGAAPVDPQRTEAAAAPPDRAGADRRAAARLQAKLAAHQGETPLILPSVDEQAVAAVVGDWTGIPVGRMVKNEVQAVLNLADTLEQAGDRPGPRPGDDRQARRRPRAPGWTIRRKPIGVFMLCGPSGVGKTETALALAEALYGGEQNLITINMSEFQEAHTVSTLKGAPPGYVGYGEGGVLTEAVRRKPYSVVLLDEVEKAHPTSTRSSSRCSTRA